jgi:hypothetical protein
LLITRHLIDYVSMALQPSLRPLIIAGRSDAPHTLDIFRKRIFSCCSSNLTCCGYSGLCLSFQVTVFSRQCTPVSNPCVEHLPSGKISVAIDKILKPWVEAGGPYEGKIKIIFRNQVQPWHATSTLTHEAGLAVHRSSVQLIDGS